MNPLALLFVFLSLWGSASAWGERAVVSPGVEGRQSVDRDAYFLEDSDGVLTFDDVRSAPWDAKFRPATGVHSFNQGISSSVFWVRLTFAASNTPSEIFAQDGTPIPSRLLLEIPYAPLDQLVFMQQTPEGELITFKAGDTQPFNARPIKHYTPVFPIKRFAKQSSDIYLRVTSSGTLRIPLTLWDEKTFIENSRIHLLAFGLYFGIMLLMVLYNLLFFVWLRDINFLNYIAYIGCLGIFQAAYFGLGFQYFWQPYPWFNQYAVILMMLLVDLFATLFARHALNLKKSMPRVDRLMKGLQLFFLVALAASLILPYSLMLYTGTIASIVQAMALLVISTVNAYRGQRSAKLFLFAWTAFLAGTVVLGGVTLGIFPATPLTSNAILFGSTIEVILLSIMLADRVHTTEKDRTRTEKKAKIALQAVNRALLDSNRVKDEFLATISHEMRTPMNGVINCLLQARHENNLQVLVNFIDNAEDAAQHLMNLIESVLSYTELQSHEFRINIETFSLPKLLEPISDMYERTAKQKGIRFQIKVNPDVPASLLGDRRRLQQILTNLADNAVKFTSQGAVNIAVSVDSLDREHHRVQLAFAIRDTGIGIPPGMENVVFDRFKQLAGSHNRRHGGLGIGLAVCKQMAALMGADLRYRSTVGEGSEFVLAINLEYAEAGANIVLPAIDIHSIAAGRSALIVEDNPVNQLVLKAALHKLGFEVLCANNGVEGVRAVENHRVDVVLMDCQMPVMDGFEATRTIRALPADRAHVPIIAITANAMSRDKEYCLDAGMNDYLCKPVNIKMLEDILLKWLQGAEQSPNESNAPKKQVQNG